MQQGFTTIPFKTESSHGLTQVNGVAKFSAAGIILDFESKLLGLIGVGVKEVRVPLAEILDIRFRKGLFKRGAKIVVRMRTFAKLAELPNNDGKLILKLARDDFERGQSAVEQLQKDLVSQNESLPPQQTPVGQLFQDESEEETKTLE
ncbi:MAG TPA: hypothetical protein VL572_01845 [Pyrinomonadaceae bacterium]|nr:hypothetical protein [Pyrinomonadaceae bacterium]